jgi:hypothetical protein
MKTQWKIMVLLTMSAGFVAFAACSGGGGASDGNGNSVSAQVSCYTTDPGTCTDGSKPAVRADDKACPYSCGSGRLSINTNGTTATATGSN